MHFITTDLISTIASVITVIFLGYRIMINHLHHMEDRLLVHIAEVQRSVHDVRKILLAHILRQSPEDQI